MVDLDTSLAEYLYRGTTGAIEELTIMRDDDISSFPGMLEIVLEPLDRDEVDEVGWFIEQ